MTNEYEDSLSILRFDTLEETARVRIGLHPIELDRPERMVLSADYESAFILFSRRQNTSVPTGPHDHGGRPPDGYCSKVSLETLADEGQAITDVHPADVVLLRDGAIAAVSSQDEDLAIRVLHEKEPPEDADKAITFLDTATMEVMARVVVCAAPSGMAADAGGSTLYVGCLANDQLAVLRIGDESRSLDSIAIERIDLGERPGTLGHPNFGPMALAVSPLDGTVWVSVIMTGLRYLDDGEVWVFDPQALAFEKDRRVRHEGDPMFGVFGADGRRLYVPFSEPDHLIVMDPANADVVADVPLEGICLNAHTATLSPDQSRLYLVCEGDHRSPGSLVELDATSIEVRRVVEVGVSPNDVAIRPPGQ